MYSLQFLYQQSVAIVRHAVCGKPFGWKRTVHAPVLPASFKNIEKYLTDLGGSLSDVVQVTVCVKSNEKDANYYKNYVFVFRSGCTMNPI